MHRVAATVLVATVFATASYGSSSAQSPVYPNIDRARAALAVAQEQLDSATNGTAQLAALGKAVTAHELALAAFRDGLRLMATRESRIRNAIAEDRARLEDLIAALQSLGLAPRSALLAFPGGPVGAARGASLMAEISPVLSERIEVLRERLGLLQRLRSSQDVARIEARGALASLQELRGRTTEALRRNRRKGLATRSELAEQTAAIAAQAGSIDALAKTLATAAESDPSVLLTFEEARGFVQPPVAGRKTADFGDPDPWGRDGFGLTITAPAFAQVSAPWDGTIRYAGPLIDYGTVVVLEPQQDILIVMAGLATVDRLVGETVLAGERLGGLGGPIPASEEFLLEASTDRDQISEEMLYIELRQNGSVIDPADWFDFTAKGSGG